MGSGQRRKWIGRGLAAAVIILAVVAGIRVMIQEKEQNAEAPAAEETMVAVPDGWQLYFHDEFDGDVLDDAAWSRSTGYFLDSAKPETAGWGNMEAEYYTDEPDNSFVKDGMLHLVAKKEPRTFTGTDQAATRVNAGYSSGKILSKDKVHFTYGRVDFRAKLPEGKGLWPALWMLPNRNTYGVWAASGEMDIMEARGRVPDAVSGTIHYGGEWPLNTYTGTDYQFPEGTGYADGFHVYSLVWEADQISWYVDGNCYQTIPKDQWYSRGADSDTAPFDRDFYLIMNLAVGGNFDSGVLPADDFTSAEMLVDYVRVYQKADTAGNVSQTP